MKKTLALAIAMVLCVTLLLSGCGDKYETKSDKALNETVVATVQGVDITQADYNFIYGMSFQQMSQYAQIYGEEWLDQPFDEEGKKIGDMLKDSAYDQCAQLVAIEILAEEYDVDTDNINDLVKENKQSVIEQQGGAEGYISFLESLRTTDKAIETYLRRSNIYVKLQEKITKDGGAAYIKDEDVVKEFSESYMTVQHILITTQSQGETDENGNPVATRTDEEALALANEVIAKVESGEDFNKLIEQYNEDPGMTAGSFYTFTDGEMVPEFEEASKNLKAGEYTKEAVKTDYGYHIIKKYDVDTESEKFTTFKQNKVASKVDDIIAKKVDSLKITKKTDVVNKYINEWVKTLNKELFANMPQSNAPVVTDPSATVETVPVEGETIPMEEGITVEGETAPAEGEATPAE